MRRLQIAGACWPLTPRRRGSPLGIIDGLLAATAVHHNPHRRLAQRQRFHIAQVPVVQSVEA